MPESVEEEVRLLGEETLSAEHYALRRYSFEYRRRDGSRQSLRREVYFNGPGAAVLLQDRTRGTLLLTRQFRLPAQLNGDPPWLIEACAGVVEQDEDPAQTVRKEAEQELGYRLHDLRQVMEVYASPGASAEKLYLFLAGYSPGDRLGEGGGLREEGEEIETLELSLDDAWRMIRDGRIRDAKTVLLIQHLLLERAGLSPG